ncbi:MAG TPA: hypothetical protein VFA99_14520 [Acidobacteriaceae bacterium]|nr:hypothetical protein [Acidobacteriaceae bacterium]
MSISRDPGFRDQYAGGLQPDPDVEAALAGSPQGSSSSPQAIRRAPSSMPGLTDQFGPMVKLR